MMDGLGFYNTSGTRTVVRRIFTTHAKTGGNIAPLSAFEAADIRIYRAADSVAHSNVQRNSSNGITMTSPFDTLTGVHEVAIDLTDDSDSGFYAAGYRYTIVLSPDSETIDGETITGLVIGEFEIGLQTVDATKLGGSATPVTNLTTVYSTDFATVYDTTNKAFLAKLGDFPMGGSSCDLTLNDLTCGIFLSQGIKTVQFSTYNILGNTFVIDTDGNVFTTGVVSLNNAANDITGIDVAKLVGSATAALRLMQMFGVTRLITVDDATFPPSTTQFETDQTTDASGQYTEQVVYGLSGANAGVTTPITGYAFTNSKVKLTVEALPSAPADGDEFLIMGRIEQ